MDEAIANVVLVTNTSPEKAAQYLTLADGDVDQAVTLFFENGGADLVAVPSSSATQPRQPPSRPETHGLSHNPINLDDDDDHDSNDDDPQITGFRSRSENNKYPTFEDDAALARRLQEEDYGGKHEEEPVRAPIARQSETLLGPGTDMGPLSGLGMEAAIQQQMAAIRGRGRGQRPGIFSQQPTTSAIWNGEQTDDREVLAQATGGASEASSRANTLARLYQPPWDLMFKESWDRAREEGRELKKWLLVNIQDGSVFQCQILNRDLWKNPGVVETVKANFLFLQYSKEDPRAEPYVQYYFSENDNSDYYPHIAIIDPRTGERMKLWSREVPSPEEFLMQLHEFLDRYSLEDTARNPVAKRKSVTKPMKSVDQMSEEEMMEMALQASLATGQNDSLKPPPVEDPDDLTRSIGDLHKHGEDDESEGESQGDAMSLYQNGNTPTPFSLISGSNPHVEPAPGPNVTRIQVRHPAGRVIRRFLLKDHVRRIYEFLKAEPLEGKEGAAFELVSMGKNLLESIDETIEDAGLKNGTVMVEFLNPE